MTDYPRWNVCPSCDGDKTSNTSPVYFASDLDEMDPYDYEMFGEMQRSGMLSDPCEFCKGEGLVSADRMREFDSWAEYEYERRMEMRAGC